MGGLAFARSAVISQGGSFRQTKKRICRELFDLRNRKREKPRGHQVVRKCTSPVAPTCLGNEPFGENVEGLSLFRNESCYVTLLFKNCIAMV